MMEGIDSTFSAAIFIGYHSATTNTEGVRAHTISSATFSSIRINGQSMAESGINAMIAGHFGVPVVMVSGDSAAVSEVRATTAATGGVEGAVVKRAISFHAAAVMTPEASQVLIRNTARAAIQKLAAGGRRALAVSRPLVLELTYKNYTPAELMAYMPGIERVDAHTIRFRAQNIREVSKFITFSTGYRADLTP
jgi:D-amino peptidase